MNRICESRKNDASGQEICFCHNPIFDTNIRIVSFFMLIKAS